MGNYTATELAEMLKSDGIDISKRTINFYAFEKNMFGEIEKGKKCFTNKERDDIKKIKLLQQYTNLSLDEIKKTIEENSLEEIASNCYDNLITCTENYSKPNNSILSSTKNNDKLEQSNAVLCNSGMNDNSSFINKARNNNYIPCGDNDIYLQMHSNFEKVAQQSISNDKNTYKEINSDTVKDDRNCARTVKINNDVTITVTKNINTDKLIDIINYINKL